MGAMLTTVITGCRVVDRKHGPMYPLSNAYSEIPLRSPQVYKIEIKYTNGM